MKRFFTVIPTVIIILVACGTPAVQVTIPTNEPNSIYANQSATIFSYLNTRIEAMESETEFARLEHITGAHYQVVNVSFPLNKNDGTALFRIETRCKCNENSQCCSPTRTFVVTLMAMDDPAYAPGSDPIIGMVGQINTTVSNLEVWSDNDMKVTDDIYVPWADVKSFLSGEINGFQLASKVMQTPSP